MSPGLAKTCALPANEVGRYLETGPSRVVTRPSIQSLQSPSVHIEKTWQSLQCGANWHFWTHHGDAQIKWSNLHDRLTVGILAATKNRNDQLMFNDANGHFLPVIGTEDGTRWKLGQWPRLIPQTRHGHQGPGRQRCRNFSFSPHLCLVPSLLSETCVRVTDGRVCLGLVDLAASTTGATKRTNQSLDIAHQTSESSNWSILSCLPCWTAGEILDR